MSMSGSQACWRINPWMMASRTRVRPSAGTSAGRSPAAWAVVNRGVGPNLEADAPSPLFGRVGEPVEVGVKEGAEGCARVGRCCGGLEHVPLAGVPLVCDGVDDRFFA